MTFGGFAGVWIGIQFEMNNRRVFPNDIQTIIFTMAVHEM